MEVISCEKWDTCLDREHKLIERAMTVLAKNLVGVEFGEFDTALMTRTLNFLLDFGENVHNKKEEAILFPLMRERHVPMEGDPFGALLMEHQTERDLLARMILEVPNLADQSAERRAAFKQEGMDYLRARADHIWKEDGTLYPLGRQNFSANDASFLLAQFNKIDLALYGENGKEEVLGMVEEMEKTAGVRTPLGNNFSTGQLLDLLNMLPFEVTIQEGEDNEADSKMLDYPKVLYHQGR